jgi:hypothetical protein
MLDIENNKKMHFRDVREIQRHLMRNKAQFDEDRLQEWKERKALKKEEEDTDNYNLKETLTKQEEDFEARF